MRILPVVAICLGAAIGAPAFAQADLMKNFTAGEMRSAITEAGAKITDEGDTDAKIHWIDGKTDSGLNFTVYAMECDKDVTPQHCTGANMTASFTIKSSRINEALDAIDYAAVADWKGTDGKLKVSRYVIFDDGITRQNLVVNLKVFMNLANKIWDKLDQDNYFDS